MPQSLLYLEDLHPGQRFQSAAASVDAAQIKAFAAQYDPQPFHLDETLARKSFFGTLVASGWQTAALSMRLVVQSVPLAGGLIGAASELRWPQPTRPGDSFTVYSEIIEVRASQRHPERGSVTVRSETRTADDRVLLQLTSKLIVYRRREGAGAGL